MLRSSGYKARPVPLVRSRGSNLFGHGMIHPRYPLLRSLRTPSSSLTSVLIHLSRRRKPIWSLPPQAALSTGRPRLVPYSSSIYRSCFSTMATATEIHLSPATDSGIFTTGPTEDAARAASEVLQEDMENHHVFFNDSGFHST